MGWRGSPTPEVESVNLALEDLAESYPDQVSGTSYCSDYSGIAIFITADGESARAKAGRLAESTSVPVHIMDADYPLETLRTEQAALRSSYESLGLIGSVPRVDGSGIMLLAPEGPAGDLEGRLLDQVKLESEVPLEVGTGALFDASTRRSDLAPHEGGLELDMSGGGHCSLGLPVYRGGIERAITAGHCVGSQTHNGGSGPGSNYTTTWPGNADIYGDWKMLTGGSYDHEVFTGSLSSNTVLPIRRGEWGARSHGSQLCASGRTTGSTCRYYVFDTWADYYVDGTLTAFGTFMYHDSDQNGSPDNNGWATGDSGGPCYSSYSDGVAVWGVVSGTGSGGYKGYNAHACTMLAGIREWDSSVTVFAP